MERMISEDAQYVGKKDAQYVPRRKTEVAISTGNSENVALTFERDAQMFGNSKANFCPTVRNAQGGSSTLRVGGSPSNATFSRANSPTFVGRDLPEFPTAELPTFRSTLRSPPIVSRGLFEPVSAKSSLQSVRATPQRIISTQIGQVQNSVASVHAPRSPRASLRVVVQPPERVTQSPMTQSPYGSTQTLRQVQPFPRQTLPFGSNQALPASFVANCVIASPMPLASATGLRLSAVSVPSCRGVASTNAGYTVLSSATARKPLTQPWAARLGALMPDFPCKTTHGNFNFHEFLDSDPEAPWTILLSHPKDFTPVCTTELGKCETLVPDFASRGVKLIGLSCDSVESHWAWSADILYREGIIKQEGPFLAFPIISDADRRLATMLGMLDPEELDEKGSPLPARALIVIGPEKTVKTSILYPATTGRNFDEVIRVLDSLHLTAKYKVATPANWQQGGRCCVCPEVSMEAAWCTFKNMTIDELPSGKQYLRRVDCPSSTVRPAADSSGVVQPKVEQIPRHSTQ